MEQPMGTLLLSDYIQAYQETLNPWMEQPLSMLLLSDYIQAYQETLNGAANGHVIT